MSEVRKKISEALSGMKYVFPDLQCNGATKFPNPDSEELESFTDFITSLVNDFRKKSFIAGFKKFRGPGPYMLPPDEAEMQELQANIDAERFWQEFDK